MAELLICVLCDEPIDSYDAWVPLNPEQYAHHGCSLREVIGGIGHLLAHDWWCREQHDPDAGLTFRQSARMVSHLVDVLGIEEVIRRGTCGPVAAEEAEEVEGTLFVSETWRAEEPRWRTDPEQDSGALS